MKPLLAALLFTLLASAVAADRRPNIVLVVAEDMGPDTGAYGCKDAITPVIGFFGTQVKINLCIRGFAVSHAHRYQHLFAKSACLADHGHGGLEYHRLATHGTQLADDKNLWVNYSLQPLGKLTAKPKEPFFAYINDTVSHESQVRASDEEHAKNTTALKPSDRRDPAKVELPPFYPDTPSVRREVAHYHELVTAVDYTLGRVLDWLKAHDLEKNTIVIFTGDHGRGMPRFKRSPKDTGTRVPLIIRWPDQLPPGTVREDFASWIDFAPTFLTLAGVPVPPEFDGHCFLPKAAQPTKYVYSFRDFMDESFDKVRSVRDARYRYVRNLGPGVNEAGEVAYQEAGQTMHELRRVQAEGKLTPIQALYFDPNRPKEQLYDTQSDPWEVKDLAGDPAHAAKLAELRAECDAWLARCGPLADMHADELVQRGIILPRKPVSQKPSKKEKVPKSQAKLQK
ncbi:MAG: hypothetical protein EBS96_12405 [Spartobacteria bacterium]|nr:hypothetical protein [Spartobacteria bacterium]